MHTQTPRFLMEFTPGGSGEMLLIDACEDQNRLADLREKARVFFSGD